MLRRPKGFLNLGELPLGGHKQIKGGTYSTVGYVRANLQSTELLCSTRSFQVTLEQAGCNKGASIKLNINQEDKLYGHF